MKCFTSEQLAEIALKRTADDTAAAHLRECAACTTTLRELTQLDRQLEGLHDALEHRQRATRAALLARLADVEMPTVRRKVGRAAPTAWRRIALGGLSLSAAAALLLVVFSPGSTEQASAMERMLARLREVTSFEYAMHTRDTHTRPGADEPVSVDYVGTVRWQSPHAIGEDGRHAHSEQGLIYEFPANSRPGERKVRLLSRFEVRVPAGELGILIDHLRECFLRVPEFRGDFGDQSPVTRLRMVKDREGEMLRELGTKSVGGKVVQGFVMRLAGVEKGSGYDALDVWIDPATDLPVEIGYELQESWGSRSLRIYDCRWNVPLDLHLFAAHAPEGYTDSTPPQSAAQVEQMIDALRLYAELSGGHFPRVERFHGDAVHREMLETAGFAGEPQASWTEETLYQRVQAASQGLDWLTRVLLSEPHAGYFGQSVELNDRGKVLFWCMTPGERDRYRVVYGNLDTEVVEGDWHQRLDEGESPRELGP